MAAHPSLSEHVEKANRWLADAGESGLLFEPEEDGNLLLLRLGSRVPKLDFQYSTGYTKATPEPWDIEVNDDASFTVYAFVDEDPTVVGHVSSLDAAIEGLLVERYRHRLHTNLENAVLDRVAHDELGGMKDGELS